MNGINGSWSHLRTRGVERVEKQHLPLVGRVVLGLARRAKARNLPNRPWYRVVTKDGKIVAIVCGQGVHLSTILTGEMKPSGTKI